MATRDVVPDKSSGVGDIPPIALQDGKISEFTASYMTSAFRTIIAKLNGGISYGNGESGYRAGNLDAQYIDVITPSVADTEFVIPHGLGRRPIGYDIVRRDQACIVYDSSVGSWGQSLLYLKCNTASATIKLRVY